MKTVVVDTENTVLRIKAQSLFINEQRIPMHLVEMLVLAHNVALDSKVLIQLSKNSIATLMIDKKSTSFALTLPLEAKNSEQKIAQYRSLENRLGFAKYFVNQKISTHVSHLKVFGVVVDERHWHEQVDSAKQISDLLGCEGSFSRLYFKHYFSHIPKLFHKAKRSKRPPQDPLNTMMSYLYTLAYNVITVELYKAGLDPAISYLHEPFRSHYALSSDFVELFRAQLNAQAAEWFIDGTLCMKDFKRKDGIYLHYNSRKRLWETVTEMMQTIALQTNKEIALLKAAIL